MNIEYTPIMLLKLKALFNKQDALENVLVKYCDAFVCALCEKRVCYGVLVPQNLRIYPKTAMFLPVFLSNIFNSQKSSKQIQKLNGAYHG